MKVMNKTEILDALPGLTSAERAEVQAKLDELAGGGGWQDNGELSDADKQALDEELEAYKASPNEGSSWDEAKARILAG